MRHIELNNEVAIRKNGFYQVEKDKEAIGAFMEEVKAKSLTFHSVRERIEYLIKHEYYYPVTDDYTMEEIEDVFALVYAEGFSFQSYMAASKFYKDYAMKTDDKAHYLETYEDRIAIVALYLARGDADKAKRYAKAMIEQRYQPATPSFMNAGKSRRGEMVSCFLLEMDDSLNSIGYNFNTAMQLSKIGGGVAINLSKIRGRQEAIKGVQGAASGIVPVMKLLEDAFSYVDQLGQRKGAGAAYYNIFGLDVMEFLDTKKINADEKSRIKTLSIGLIIPRKFFELAKTNQPMFVFGTHSVFQAYGKHLDDLDIDELYEDLVRNPKVVKKQLDLSAREMLIKIAMTQMESGYPYIMYKTNANDQHALKDIGDIKMSNLCSEIFQLMETSSINDYGKPDVIRRDISCNLGSLNIVNVMERKAIRDSVHCGMDMLTAVSDMTQVENAPGVRKANEELHSVGLGAMNLHGYLAKNQIAYESEEARDFARTFFMMMNYYSLERSMLIAKERKETFRDFDKSEYKKGTYFERYLGTDYAPKTDKVRALFDGIAIPGPAEWKTLKRNVQKYGLYHAYRQAIAPTQSISYLQNATSSVLPVVDQMEIRTYANATTYYPMPFLSPDTFWYYKSAYNMNQMKLIDLIAEIQPHIDQGISTILYVTSEATTRDLARLYIYAQEKGLKSLYYTRTKMLSVEECTSCSV